MTTKEEALKKLVELKKHAGEVNSEFQKALQDFKSNWGDPGRDLDNAGDHTNGGSGSSDHSFFGLRKKKKGSQ